MNYFNKKGSTLAFIMIVIAILSLLGVTLLTVTLAGFTMKVNEGYNKKAFYIAEGGLEQANAIIEKAMQDASEYARSKAKTDFATFIGNERSKQEADRGDKTKNYQSKYKSPYFYQRFFESTGKYTYDYYNNLLSEFNVYGKEIDPKISIFDAGEFELDTDPSAKLDGLVESMVNKKLNEYYTNAYTVYLNSIDIAPDFSPSLELKLEKLSTYNAVLYENPKDLVKNVDVIDIDYFGETNSDSMEIIFRSSAAVRVVSGSSTNEKSLESTFKIGIPPYDAPVLKDNEIVKLKKNALFDKTLVSEKNIIVTGKNEVTINGNIFARGLDQISPGVQDYLNMGGIVVGDKFSLDTYKEGNLTVDGTIATSGFLQTRNSNSDITAKGNVYCNSLIAQQDWESEEFPDEIIDDNVIILEKDLNLLDNLNLNSKDAKVTVKGNFFGFSDGSTSSLHNQSSSIAINDVGIGNAGISTSSIDILGEGDETKYKYNNSEGTEAEAVLDHGTYIAGTVYVNYELEIAQKAVYSKVGMRTKYGYVKMNIDGGWIYIPDVFGEFNDDFTLNVHNGIFDGDSVVKIVLTKDANVKNVKVFEDEILTNEYDLKDTDPYTGIIATNYQTGDSVSIAGNYLAYSMKLDGVTVNTYASGSKNEFVDIKDSFFESIPPLSLVNKLPNNPNDPNDQGKSMSVMDKSLYARMARVIESTSEEDDQFFNFGKGQIKISNVRYSLGNYIENLPQNKSDFQKMKPGNANGSYSTNESLNGELNSLNIYALALNFKGMEYKYYVNKMSDPQINNYIDNTKNDLDKSDLISDFFEFPEVGIYEKIIKENESDKIYYASAKGESIKAFSLQGPGSNLPTGLLQSDCIVADFEDIDLEGIIVSKGDVYISGRINFTGTIVTEGNIYIMDENVKNFTNDYNPNLLSKTNNSVINKILMDNPELGEQIGDMFIQDDDWTNEIIFTKDPNTQILDSEGVKTYTDRLSRYVTIIQWKKIK